MLKYVPKILHSNLKKTAKLLQLGTYLRITLEPLVTHEI